MKKIAAIVAPVICVCIAFAVVLNMFIIPSVRYNSAVKLYEEGKYEEAYDKFSKKLDYKDSSDKARDSLYNYALELYEKGNYKEAYNKFIEQLDYEDSSNKAKDALYNYANELYEQGNYEEAYNKFNEQLDYKDCSDKAENALYLKQLANFSNIKVGDTVKFGSYEQDGNNNNGKEEINWIVLKIDGKKALLVSEYGLSNQKYNNTGTDYEGDDILWKNCKLRNWLNNEFYNEAFGDEHKKLINNSEIGFGVNSTMDKVFILNPDEAYDYLGSGLRKCKATQSVNPNGNNGEGLYVRWWLRPEDNQNKYWAYVDGDEISPMVFGDGISIHSMLVRPSIWVNIKS